MKRSIKLLAVIISIVVLTGCNNSKNTDLDTEEKTGKVPLVKEAEELAVEETSIFPPDLNSEEGVIEYLVGEWVCNIEYMSNIVVNMNIYENLDVQLSFNDSFKNEAKGEYKGKISFDRVYAKPDEAPDVISIELDDSKYAKGDFFFLHRTIYDEKRLMSLFFTGNGESVFNILLGYDNDDDYEDDPYIIEEVMLEKVTGEISEEKPRKNDSFYAVFWGHDVLFESIWLDDVDWTLDEEDDFARDHPYPRPMTEYANDKYESIIYRVNPDKQFEILGDNMFKGSVYYVETDENGHMVELIDAAYKEYLEESEEDYYNKDDFHSQTGYYFEQGGEGYIYPEFAEFIFGFLKDIDEVEEYLEAGMSVLFTGETVIIDNEDCHFVFLGTNLEESFVREIHYAVNTNTGQVYYYDILNDRWEYLSLR